MQYCFDTVGGTPVLWLYGSIGEGSAENVARGIRQSARYREVWLNSPGGLVDEGFDIGRELRRMKVTVRVPSHPDVVCASSCTNLSLGGVFRIVEEGARFYAHAMSSVMNIQSTTPVAQRRSGVAA